ncbi:CocE/NonD family hydrolase [Paraliomyxa miuraensis]|uniref:CocE/NonD family hydrolase n=1 Tax=Paraliomyxa miuraensis TaxID=376150 RepID=UPI00225365D9|nr:CocE/NonD family hydrolase [Paraliomyxa miuraensis]MCX4242098.1 CocE/NonD family hydrolase [Paraliomyxa miuraensis]
MATAPPLPPRGPHAVVRSIAVLGLSMLACRATPDGTTDAPSPTAPAEAEHHDDDAPAPLDGLADTDTFTFYVDGNPLATIAHDWQADGRYRAETTLKLGGQTIEQSLHIDVDESGAFTRIEAKSQGQVSTFVRDGSQVTFTGPHGTAALELPPGTVVFGSLQDFSPALVRHVLRRYDVAAGGAQTFPALVPGSPPVEAVLTREADETRRGDGRDVALHRWHLELPGAAFELWTEPDDRVVLAQVIGRPLVFVRQGYEPLMPVEEDPDPLLSKAEHQVVVDDEVVTPMRDGTALRADVYHPAGDGPWPTIVIRTPYKKELEDVRASYYARRGYAVVAQDVRGRFASAGEWTPMVNEKKDGYDTIEWAAAQPWSTGKVGMVGPSYLGWVQWLAAVEQPPHLVTIIPNVAPPDPLYNIPYEHGVMHTMGSLWWLDVVATEAHADLTGKALHAVNTKPYDQLLRTLPVIDLDQTVLGGTSRHWHEWVAHSTLDDYWAGASYLDQLGRVEIPVLNQSGWFDDDTIGSKLAMQRMSALGREHQHLILGPWGHTDVATRQFAGVDYGPEAVAIDLWRENLRWFDHWLKGIDNGIDRQPRVRMFAMGSNRWVSGNAYPLEGTSFEKWYLGNEGHANGPSGDGTLSREPSGAASDVYVYDPADATPDLEFRIPDEWPDIAGEPSDPVAARVRRQARHERLLAERKDILVYESEPFSEDTTFVGPVSAVLHAATTAKDTDWFVRLCELDADGRPNPLVLGTMRASYRKSVERRTPVRPGKIERYTLDLWHTGITVRRGHRLRVEVSSASFPTWARNLGTGGDDGTGTEYVSATQTIHHSKRYPSYVLLPRVENPR